MKKKYIRSRKVRDLSIDVEHVADARDNDIEAHIPVLLETIGKLKLEKIDLSTAGSSEDAIAMLNTVIEKLSTYKNTASALRQILESPDAPKKH